MNLSAHLGKRRQEGSILAYFIIVVIVATAMVSVSAYVAQSARMAHRRSDMIAARQYAESGAVIACLDLGTLYTNQAASFPGGLSSLSTPYTLNSSLSAGSTKVYERTVSSPFASQTVASQVWVESATSAKIVASAKVGDVTQSATVHVKMAFGYGAAILSVNSGTTETGVQKGAAKDGNVVISGGGSGRTLIVDGGTGLAVDANGEVNVDSNANVPAGAVSSTNRGTANVIPDYTSQGTANSLFDFGRFIACADLTTNSYNTTTHNNHFTNVASFAAALSSAPNHTVEGVVVVDIKSTDGNWNKAGDSGTFPNGINIHGTLFYNFGPDFTPTTKFTMTTPLNINAANLSGLNTTNSSSFTSGYPPVYTDNSKNPTNIVITSKGYTNFVAGDDLPALMYSIGEVDIHGPANVSGVCYTPSYMEIENKQNNQVQYFKGMLIMGQGIYIENNSSGAISIFSYDRNALDNLSTLGTRGKIVTVAYWQ